MEISSGSITDFGNTANSQKTSSLCDIEIEQARRDDDWSQVSDDCLEYVPEKSQDEAVTANVESEIT